ncbi:MAG: choice-of-anchor B family protein [Flavobacteriales bacterium]|nr:choice-of-anchor B family protein [Flavobacteriales bacterium]
MRTFVRLFLAINLWFSAQAVWAQDAFNTTELGHLAYTEDLSEVRGAFHNGHEYALVGVYNGFSIVDVTDPTTPTEVFFAPGANSIWRDPFYHNGYAYCVNETSGGLLIVDMSPLPGSTNLTSVSYSGSQFPWTKAHNMFVDTEADKAYIFGSNNGVGGALILDISNPTSPTELGRWNDHYIHDGFVRGDTLWAACLEQGSFVVDVSTPSNPVVLANWDTPSQFSHNIWPSDNNEHCFTTDEVNSGFVAAYDMSNLNNVVETDKVRHPLTEGVIPHNTHFINDYIVTSHYRDGLVIHDVSDPSNIILTGYFDTSPFSGGGFNGAWGAWPYLPSGNILIADIEEGLFIVGPDYVRAARLQGNVTEFGSGSVLNAVQIDVVGTGLTDVTDLFGDYATGTATAGTYSVTFQKGGYLPQTINGVVLTNGATVTLDVQMIPDVPFVLSGLVLDAASGQPVSGATVHVVNDFLDEELTTDANGVYSDTNFYAGQYAVTAGKWGYIGECGSIDFSSGSVPDPIELLKGYYDDFSLDLGWTVSGTAASGIWERGFPIETIYLDSISNPGSDMINDCDGNAYVTGNGGGGVGDDDVDQGVTILKSPLMDLSSLNHPALRFNYWFFNSGGNDAGNDTFKVKVEYGPSITTVASLPVTANQWKPFSFSLLDHIPNLSNPIQLIIEVEDVLPGHLVEGAIDVFSVEETTGIASVEKSGRVSLFPNPASHYVNLQVDGAVNEGSAQIWDVAGRAVGESRRIFQGLNTLNVPRTTGIYLLETIIDGQRQVQRLVVDH